MPRPTAGRVSACAARPSTAFEDLLGRVRGEHSQLQQMADALAAENNALRKRLRLCGGGGDVDSSCCINAAPGAEHVQLSCCVTATPCHETMQLSQETSSLWRRRQITPVSPMSPKSPSRQEGNAIVPAAKVETLPEFGVGLLREHSTQESCAGSNSSAIGHLDTEAPDKGEDRRIAACVHKLRAMLELAEMKLTVSADNIIEYFGRVGLDSPEMNEAVTTIMTRLREHEELEGTALNSRQLFASNSMRSTRASKQLGKSKSRLPGLVPQVKLETLAALLLTDSIEDWISPVTEHVAEVVRTLRTHTFHQDIMGILPSAIAVSHLEQHQKESKFDNRMDLVMNIVIAANAVCMGWFARDRDEVWGTAQIADVVFTLIFLLEGLIKLKRGGFREYFCGREWAWNIFDASIITLGLSDFIMTLLVVSSGDFNPSSLMTLKLLRLGRLLRVIRMSMFRELRLMVNGIVGLMKTLGSALVILLVGVYFVGTIMVQLFGGEPEAGQELVHGQAGLFGTVPRSMFTVFRCLNLGDCAAADGTPIALQMSEAVGWPFTITHCILCVLMNYGLGSLITALVVDTTLNEAKKAEFRASLKDSHKKHISWSLHRLEQIFEEAQQSEEGDMDVRPGVPSMLFLSRKCFQGVLNRPEVQTILDEMDIDASDRADLFDAIDADGNGRVEVDELVGGLLRMSGKARRADTVAARLKIDALVKRLTVTHAQVQHNHQQIMEHLDAMGGGNCTPGNAANYQNNWPPTVSSAP